MREDCKLSAMISVEENSMNYLIQDQTDTCLPRALEGQIYISKTDAELFEEMMDEQILDEREKTEADRAEEAIFDQ